MKFKLVSPFKPTGDQPHAIERLTEQVRAGVARQTLLGVTGSGKTFTAANVIERVQKPTLVISRNKAPRASPRSSGAWINRNEAALPAGTRGEIISSLEKEMKQAVRSLDFERAAKIRDRLKHMRAPRR